MILFTYLKIILLQYFQFLAISGIQINPEYASWRYKYTLTFIMVLCLYHVANLLYNKTCVKRIIFMIALTTCSSLFSSISFFLFIMWTIPFSRLFCTHLKLLIPAKGLVTKLASSHTQSAWESRGKRVRVMRLTACCNYLYFKKKKKKLLNPTNKELTI